MLTNPDYQKIIDIIKNSSLAGSKIPFFTEANGTYISSYYEDGKSTSNIGFDRNTNQTNFMVLATRSYLLVPEGFSLVNLLLPGTPSAA